MRAHRVGDFDGALAQPLHQLAAVDLHGAVEFGEVLGDQAAERAGVARDLLGELGAAVGEHFLERLQPRAQHLAHAVALGVDGRFQRVGGLAERVGHLAAARQDGLGDARAGFLELADHVAAAQRQVEHQRLAGRLQGVVDVVGARRDRLGEPAAGVGHLLGQRLRALRHLVGELLGGARHVRGDVLGAAHQRLGDRQRLLRHVVGHMVEARGQHLRELHRQVGDLRGQVIGLDVDVRRHLVARGFERARDFLAGARHLLEQVAAALADRLDHGVAGASERERDVLALLGQRAGHALRGVVDARRHHLAHRRDVLGEAEMHAGDRVAHLLGLSDQAVALVGEVLDQAADAQLVVVVGALQRRDLVVHQRFQLGGARERALHAVAHGGDLAADRLSDRHDRLARDRLRLGEPHRGLGHRARDDAQLLRAADHVRDHVEQQHRQRDAGREREQRRMHALAERGPQVAAEIGRPDQHAEDDPGDREEERGRIGRARGTLLQRLQHLPDRLAVVIGGALDRLHLVEVGRRRRAARRSPGETGPRRSAERCGSGGGGLRARARTASRRSPGRTDRPPEPSAGPARAALAAGAGGSSRRLRASWIADIAASVGS